MKYLVMSMLSLCSKSIDLSELYKVQEMEVYSVKPKLLDLFCGAGGAAMGYYRLGAISLRQSIVRLIMPLDCSYMPVKPLNKIILLLSLATKYAIIKAR